MLLEAADALIAIMGVENPMDIEGLVGFGYDMLAIRSHVANVVEAVAIGDREDAELSLKELREQMRKIVAKGHAHLHVIERYPEWQ